MGIIAIGYPMSSNVLRYSTCLILALTLANAHSGFATVIGNKAALKSVQSTWLAVQLAGGR